MAGQENIHLGGDDGGFGDIDHLADGDARMDYYKFTFSEEFAQNPLAFADTCAFVKEHDNVFHRANATAYELVGSTSRMFLPGKNFVFRVEGDRFSVSVYTPKILAQNDVYEALVIEGGKVTINGEGSHDDLSRILYAMRGREESGVHFPSQRSSFKNYFSYQYDKLRIESRGYEKHLTDEEKGRLKTELFLTKQGLAELLKKPLPDYGSMYLQVEQVKIVVEKYASMAKSNQLLIDILEDAVIFEAMLGDPIIPNVPKEDIIRVIQEMIDDRRPELESLGESLAKTLFERHKIKLHPEDVINIIPFLLSKTKILDSMP